MNEYGMIIKSERTSKAFKEGYKSLNFHVAGITQQDHGIVFYLDINCPTTPVVFYRSAQVNGLSAPHYVVKTGYQTYRVYTIGQCEIFIFKTVVVKSNVEYGIEIYSENSELVYQSSDIPIKPFARRRYPALLKGEQHNFNFGTTRKLAYSLMGSAGEFDIDFVEQRITAWRSVVQSLAGGFGLRYSKITDATKDNDIDVSNFFSNTAPPHHGSNFVSGQTPIDMLIVDVHDLAPNAPAVTFY